MTRNPDFEFAQSAERWLPVVDFPNYEVSDFGRVRRAVSAGTRWPAGRLLKSTPLVKGYLGVTLLKDGKKHTSLIHRLVVRAFIGPKPTPIHQAAHSDGNNQNNVLGNLRWATPVENAADRLAHGNQPWGSRSPLAKLTEHEVRAIRAATGRHADIGADFGVSKSAVCHIKSGRCWAHLEN